MEVFQDVPEGDCIEVSQREFSLVQLTNANFQAEPFPGMGCRSLADLYPECPPAAQLHPVQEMPCAATHIEDAPWLFPLRNHPASLGDAIAIVEIGEVALCLSEILVVRLIIGRIVLPYFVPGRPGVEIGQPALLALH